MMTEANLMDAFLTLMGLIAVVWAILELDSSTEAMLMMIVAVATFTIMIMGNRV